MKRLNKSSYYCFLVSLIGEKTVSTKELYGLIQMTDEHFGIKSKVVGRESRVTKELEEILGSKISSIEDTETRRYGRGIPRYYSISGSLEDTSRKIVDYYAAVLDDVPKKTKKEDPAVVESKDGDKFRPKKIPSKEFLMRIWKVLKSTKRSATERIDFEDIPRIMGYKKFKLTESRWRGWMKFLQEQGLTITYAVYPGLECPGKMPSKVLEIKGDGSLLNLREKLKKWHGIDLDYVDVSSKKVSVPVSAEEAGVTKKAAVVVKKESETDQDYVKFLISALIRKNNNRAVEIENVDRIIYESFGKWLGKTEILNLLKTEDDLLAIRDKNAITFRDGEESWKRLKEKYSPEELEPIHMRLGLSEEELGTLRFEKVEVESRISENDNIFTIWVRKNSRKDFRKLVTLYGSFRGTDCIIGNKELKEALKKQVLEDQRMVKDNDGIYQLENVI